MSNSGFIAVAYLVTAGAVGTYVLRILRQGRRVAARVPAERRRWM